MFKVILSFHDVWCHFMRIFKGDFYMLFLKGEVFIFLKVKGYLLLILMEHGYLLFSQKSKRVLTYLFEYAGYLGFCATTQLKVILKVSSLGGMSAI